MYRYAQFVSIAVLGAAFPALAVDLAPALPTVPGGTPAPVVGDVLWDTGPPRLVLFDPAGGGNHVETFLGFSSGNIGAGFEDRRAAMPFVLPDPGGGQFYRITQIDLDYFTADTFPTDLNFRVYARNGEGMPTSADIVIDMTVPAPVGMDDPEVDGADDFLHQIFPEFDLDPGEYYLSIYSAAPAGSNIAWFTNADNGIPFVDEEGAWMWRQATEGAGFEFYQLSQDVFMQVPGLDPHDIYSQSFSLYGQLIPEPATLALLAMGAVVALKRRR